MMTKMKKINVLIYQVTRFARDNNYYASYILKTHLAEIKTSNNKN